MSADVKAAIMAADVLMGNDQDAARWIRAHRDAAAAAAGPVAATAVAGGLAVLPGGAAGRPEVSSGRPRINRRALAAAAAMRDAAGGTDTGRRRSDGTLP